MNITLKLIMAATALIAVAGGVIFNHLNGNDDGDKSDLNESHDMAIRNIPSADSGAKQEPDALLNQ
ncbi:hypothetical protein [Budvicia aquatica]|uniref:Uncharacterized protein n=1 Tax=Budvicia aquatica TaxID=82979 RepID=A0A2C6DJ72_9GAMM|nr:hypothetical protein [Budvicia aquatica]PHI28851.1 hypothetical protein CRN84_05765 [Budvicia aquatica]PHI30887.1 hypothetical protein CRN84_16855 [Budvicia aquatica]VFS46961.1 Uncharacterised protein [Budvicia aquatica]VFS50769.1 Uncharacterised protein [Budvicia aquatica]